MIIQSFAYFMSKIMFFTAYVNDNNGFPKPLSIEEEKLEFEKFKSGDLKAKDNLIKHNLRLVAHIVKKYSSSGEADDLLSVGTIGLIKALNTFSYEKNAMFSTYAARCIENEILMLLRVNKKHKVVLSLSEALGEDKDGNDIELADIIPDVDDEVEEIVENNIMAEKIKQILKTKLSEREYKIISLRYGLNNVPVLTQREVAKKMNISRSYVSRLETKALDDIKEEMLKNDLLFS